MFWYLGGVVVTPEVDGLVDGMSLGEKWAMNKIICFHSKTVLLVLWYYATKNVCYWIFGMDRDKIGLVYWNILWYMMPCKIIPRWLIFPDGFMVPGWLTFPDGFMVSMGILFIIYNFSSWLYAYFYVYCILYTIYIWYFCTICIRKVSKTYFFAE